MRTAHHLTVAVVAAATAATEQGPAARSTQIMCSSQPHDRERSSILLDVSTTAALV